MNGTEMIALCRETDKETGRIAVYPIESKVTGELLTGLQVRARFNPELRYFVTMRARWAGRWHDDIVSVLKRKVVTEREIKLLGGLVEL